MSEHHEHLQPNIVQQATKGCLGSKITIMGDSDKVINTTISTANQSFTGFNIYTKIRIFNSNVILYRSEC